MVTETVLVVLFAVTSCVGVPSREDVILADKVYQEQLKEYLKTVPTNIANEALMTVPELINHKGYPAETHVVTSIDGYILTMHRIPYGVSGNSENRAVVFLQHGVLSSSADWIIPGPNVALAYILADKGYDVWMGNTRGNKYSRNHTYLDPDNDVAFWDFSWHHMGIYDLPAMIDYVLAHTGQEKMFYIGHSQGTTDFYVMASQLPEYNNKIRAMFSLAPIAYMNHMTSPLLRMIALMDIGLEVIMNLIGVAEFLPSTTFLAGVGDVLCGDYSFTQFLCTSALFAICGFNTNQFNATILPIVMGHTPAGSSIYQFLHYAQEIHSGQFRQYDYGPVGNMKYYRSLTPPAYSLTKVTAVVYLHYSKNDWLSHEIDVLKLYNRLGNAKGKFLVSDENFNHLDYMYAIDAPTLLYDKILDLMERH